MIDSLKKYSTDVQFTLYPEANHNSWDTTYNNEALYSWLLQQKRFRYTEMAADSALLRQFTGHFANAEKDSVQLVIENNSLLAKTGQEAVPLRQYQHGIFFIREDLPVEIQFHQTPKGVVDYFTILNRDRKIVFYKYARSGKTRN